ncbi:MAG: hypothetical protein KGS46_05935 [Chloroflexi bacterium]|jgi:hypothetical protein|nr:hypothetical protein [Chloroflexota bacterium]
MYAASATRRPPHTNTHHPATHANLTPWANLGCSDNLLINPSYKSAIAAAVWNGAIALVNDAQHGNYAAWLSPIGVSGHLVSVNRSVTGHSFSASV